MYFSKLEDDIITTKGYVSKIKNFTIELESKTKRWILINFSELGFIGKLFRNKDLRAFINFYLLFAQYSPVDVFLEEIYIIVSCNPDLNKVI